MINDCWTEEEHARILGSVKRYLWTYLQPSGTIRELENAVQNLVDIDKEEVDYLSAVHFLLSEEVKVFVETVPKIFRRFSHSTQKENVARRSFIKGKIDWNLTTKERCAKGYDRTIFVCSPIQRVYNLPENQLLKYVLVQIKRLIEETTNLPLAKEKSCITNRKSFGDKERWVDRLSWLKFNVNNSLKSVYLREVDLPKQTNERMVKRARNARNKDYETVSESYCTHRELIQKNNFETLKKFVEQRILEPLDKDTLYELYVLFQIVDSSGGNKQINLIKPDAEAFATVNVGSDIIKVYYQKPTAVLKDSTYKEIFNDYDLDVNLRRPDIILYSEQKKRLVIVEVKNTSDKNYIADSTYKVIGYLADFKNNFTDEQQKPKAILAVWSINRLNKNNQDLIILDHNSLKEGVEEVFSLLFA